MQPICSFPECGATAVTAGLCSGHYGQRKRGEELRGIIRGKSSYDRFAEKVVQDGECWRWIGALNSHGYGNFFSKGKYCRAHRWAYEYFVAEIPAGLTLDHLCRNTWCVNPEHLDPVPQSVNNARGEGVERARRWRLAKRFCIHGHPLFGDNLYVSPTTGYRYCRICALASANRYNARQRAAKAAAEESLNG